MSRGSIVVEDVPIVTVQTQTLPKVMMAINVGMVVEVVAAVGMMFHLLVLPKSAEVHLQRAVETLVQSTLRRSLLLKNAKP